jgi:putative intracellular protease/amidase
LERAGAIWKSQEVITDGNLITARGIQEVPRLSQTFIDQLAQLYQSRSKVA